MSVGRFSFHCFLSIELLELDFEGCVHRIGQSSVEAVDPAGHLDEGALSCWKDGRAAGGSVSCNCLTYEKR